MGTEKQSSKGGNYVGGFLQMFDWNAKSRKKLFSNKLEVPEQCKQKKRCDGNLPMTRLHMLNMDENASGSSVKGSSDHSCASSVVDEDFCGTRAPGVVARLMGLDSLPNSSMTEPYSTPLFDSCSLSNAYSQTKKFEYRQDRKMHFSSLQDVSIRNKMEPSYQRVIHKPIEKFQTEILPPKLAKSIPITHHKLLSPIKSANFVPHKDAAHIMEAAARIFEPGPQVTTKSKLPTVGSSSVPLRVQDLKEKAKAAQKSSKLFEGSQRTESSTVKNLKENSMNKSWNGSVDAKSDTGGSSIDVKNKVKSISLALQAKANVQKRGGLNVNCDRNLIGQKESCELSPNHPIKSQSTTQKSMVKKPSMKNSSSVLRQNNQKQNCIVDRGKLSSKCNSKGSKTLSGESSSTRKHNSSKVSSTSRVNSRKLRSDVKVDKLEVLHSSRETVTSKKRSVDGSYHYGKNQAAQKLQIERSGEDIQSWDITDGQSSWDQNSGGAGADVISFTFTAPMARLGPDSVRPRESGETCKILSVGYQGKKSYLSSDGMSGSRFSFCGHNNVKGVDALSTLLEQKLKELADKVEFSQQNSGTDLHDMLPGLETTTSSSMPETCKARDKMHTLNEVGPEETSTSDGNISRDRKLLDCRFPSPVSVLEHSSSADSCSSSDTADSNITGGSKQCSSIQAVEVADSYFFKTYLADEPDTELSDSASSTSTGTVLKKQELTILTSTDNENPRRWEFEYVKEILSNIELMFKDYALGRSKDIIKPHLFYQLEIFHQCSSYGVPTIDRRLAFDCVSECLDLRCRQYVCGGYISWAKGLSSVRRKEFFSQEVYKEISGWSACIGDSMIDDLVGWDMSNQYGRWLDFDVEAFEIGIQIESRLLNSLINEVVADVLML